MPTVTDRPVKKSTMPRMSALFNATVDDQVLAVSISSHRAVRAATILDRYEQAEAWFAIAHNLHARLQAP